MPSVPKRSFAIGCHYQLAHRAGVGSTLLDDDEDSNMGIVDKSQVRIGKKRGRRIAAVADLALQINGSGLDCLNERDTMLRPANPQSSRLNDVVGQDVSGLHLAGKLRRYFDFLDR